MRDALAALEGQRLRFQGNVSRFGSRPDWRGVECPTLLLKHVLTVHDGAEVADHLWFKVGKRLAALDLHPGDQLQLTARVTPYCCDFRRWPGGVTTCRRNMGLVYPTHCAVVAPSQAVRPNLPTPQQPARAVALPPPIDQYARLMVTLTALWEEEEVPPSLPALFGRVGRNPWPVVKILHKLAKKGVIVFQPDGRIARATTEGSIQP